MNSLKLIEPSPEFEAEHSAMLSEWRIEGERFVPFTLDFDTTDFLKYINLLNDLKRGIGIPDNFVPHSTYWLINSNYRILGCVNIRHYLTESLYKEGGHIGYGIRPSERRKGYAIKILQLALIEARTLSINKALVTCDKDNFASRQTILNCGGKFYEENVVNGVIKLSFWIDT